MKKLIFLAFASLFLVACGGGGGTPTNSGNTGETVGAVVVDLTSTNSNNAENAPVLGISRSDTDDSLVFRADLQGMTPVTPTQIVYFSSSTMKNEVVVIGGDGLPEKFIMLNVASGTIATATFAYSANRDNATITLSVLGTTTLFNYPTIISATDTTQMKQLFNELIATQEAPGAYTDPSAGDYIKITLNTASCVSALALVAASAPTGFGLIITGPYAVLSCFSAVAEVASAINDDTSNDQISAQLNTINCAIVNPLDPVDLATGCGPALIDAVQQEGNQNVQVVQPTNYRSNSDYRLTSYFSNDFYSNGNGTTINLTYDSLGRLSKKTANNNTSLFFYIYNSSNQLVRMVLNNWSNNVGIGIANGIVEFNYDTNSRINSVTYNGNTYSANYDNVGRILRLSSSSVSYQNGNANALNEDGKILNLSYLSNDALSSAVFENFTLNITYNEMGITEWGDGNNANVGFYDFSNFTYEKNDNCFVITDIIKLVDFEVGFICGGPYTIKGY